MLQGRVPLILAAVFGLLAAVVAYITINERTERVAERWDPVKVMAAAENLKPGDTLTKKNVTVIEVPRTIVTESVITLADYKKGTTPVFGLKVAMEINRGDMLLFQHIHSKTGGQHLAEAVQRKGRAVSIRVSPESSVHHWIEPGDRVDVIGVFRDPRSREMVALTMLQNVMVIATGRIGGQTNMRLLPENERAYNTVTVHVLPDAAEMLVLAQDLGSLYLSLRSPEDDEIVDLEDARTTMQTLMTGERSKRLSIQQTKAFKVEIIRGTRGAEMQTVPR